MIGARPHRRTPALRLSRRAARATVAADVGASAIATPGRRDAPKLLDGRGANFRRSAPSTYAWTRASSPGRFRRAASRWRRSARLRAAPAARDGRPRVPRAARAADRGAPQPRDDGAPPARRRPSAWRRSTTSCAARAWRSTTSPPRAAAGGSSTARSPSRWPSCSRSSSTAGRRSRARSTASCVLGAVLPGAIVVGDRLRLAQAISNLIANALEHAPGRIELDGAPRGAAARAHRGHRRRARPADAARRADPARARRRARPARARAGDRGADRRAPSRAARRGARAARARGSAIELPLVRRAPP